MRYPSFVERIEYKIRQNRLKMFLSCLKKVDKRPITMLDVGGTVEFWSGVALPQEGSKYVLLNMFQQETEPPFESVVGDACDMKEFSENQFDVVFSNSVINIVGPLERQRKMAEEIRRVGRHYFIQAPNKWFPIDWRTLIPFFHMLPPGIQEWFFMRIPVGSYRKALNKEEAKDWTTRVRDLSYKELKRLFPGSQVTREKVMGFTKSFIVKNF